MSQMHNRDREGLRTHPSRYHCNSNDQLGIREPTEVKHVFSRLNISCFMRKCLNNSCDEKSQPYKTRHKTFFLRLKTFYL